MMRSCARPSRSTRTSPLAWSGSTRERSISFKEAVNATLRAGFDAEPATLPTPYVLPTFDMGVRPGIDLDRARHLDADLEDEETIRRLSLRK